MQLISRTPARSYFITMFVVVSLLFFAFSAVIYRNYVEAQRLNQWTLYNYELIRQSRKILLDLVGMETGVRGYLITGRKHFLQPYKESRKNVREQIEALWVYTKDDPHTQKDIGIWLKSTERFAAILDNQVVSYNQSFLHLNQTKDMEKQKQQMDRLRNILENFIQVRLSDLNVRISQSKAAENDFKYILAIGTALAIGGMLIATLVILSLIRRSQRAEAESEAIERRFKMVMDGINDGLFDYDLEAGSIYFSPEYKAMLGYDDSEVPNTIDWINSVMHPDDAQATWAVFHQYREQKIPAYRNVFRLRKKNGDWVWILSRGVGLFDAHGNMTRLIGTHTDITEQKLREKQLATLNKEMETFTYITSHDLRAPLVNLKGFSGELGHVVHKMRLVLDANKATLKEGDYVALCKMLDEDIAESLRFIVQSVEKMDTLTTAVLDLSRIGKREYRNEPVQVRTLVKRCLDTLAYEISQNNITVQCGDLPNVISDALALEQVFSNIIDNAIKYLDPKRPGEIVINATATGGMLVFSVADNGRGIAKADYDKIFHIFRRARNSLDVRGSGLGMAFVQATVRRLGGSVWFTSEPGQGTTFFFSIPNKQ